MFGKLAVLQLFKDANVELAPSILSSVEMDNMSAVVVAVVILQRMFQLVTLNSFYWEEVSSAEAWSWRAPWIRVQSHSHTWTLANSTT